MPHQPRTRRSTGEPAARSPPSVRPLGFRRVATAPAGPDRGLVAVPLSLLSFPSPRSFSLRILHHTLEQCDRQATVRWGAPPERPRAHCADGPVPGTPYAPPAVACSFRPDSARGDWRARPAADVPTGSPPRDDGPQADDAVAPGAGGLGAVGDGLATCGSRPVGGWCLPGDGRRTLRTLPLLGPLRAGLLLGWCRRLHG